MLLRLYKVINGQQKYVNYWQFSSHGNLLNFKIKSYKNQNKVKQFQSGCANFSKLK